ncbi:hypothetical protein J6590_005345 [Homalodisca vitripennis]|nr:hypothetical protein J6590_005345 [Homalodisca vitripennis]
MVALEVRYLNSLTTVEVKAAITRDLRNVAVIPRSLRPSPTGGNRDIVLHLMEHTTTRLLSTGRMKLVWVSCRPEVGSNEVFPILRFQPNSRWTVRGSTKDVKPSVLSIGRESYNILNEYADKLYGLEEELSYCKPLPFLRQRSKWSGLVDNVIAVSPPVQLVRRFVVLLCTNNKFNKN